MCPLFKEGPLTVEHWLQRCPNLHVFRKRTFGSPSSPLGVLTTDPEKLEQASRAIGARLNSNNTQLFKKTRVCCPPGYKELWSGNELVKA